jgi:hypothetical protein
MSELKTIPKNKYVKCEFCKQTIHIDHWGGVYKKNGREVWFCDKVPCLIAFNDERKDADHT